MSFYDLIILTTSVVQVFMVIRMAGEMCTIFQVVYINVRYDSVVLLGILVLSITSELSSSE